MRKDRWLLRCAALLALSGTLMTGASLAAEAGTSSDPLVTLSYLNDTFLEEVLQRVDQKIADRGGQGAFGGTSFGESGASFMVVTLSQGQVLSGDVGCEVMLRIGSASCSADGTPGLVDETTGGILENGGALGTNHLYLMTIAGRGVQAGTASATLLVRGGYQIL